MVLYGSNDGIPSSGSSSPTECAEEVCSFMVIKHSWKGKYKRVFSVGTTSITTYNPNSMEATNQWNYSDFISILPAARGQVRGIINDLVLNFSDLRRHNQIMSSSSPSRKGRRRTA